MRPDPSAVPTPEEAAKRILRLLRSRRPEDGARAEEYVRELGAAAQPAMALVVRRCGRSWRIGRALLRVSSVVAFFTAGFFFGWPPDLLVVLGSLAVLLVFIYVDALTSSTVRPDLIDRASSLFDALDGPAAVSVLAEALWMGEHRSRADAARHVARVLDRLPAEQSPLIPGSDRLVLYRALQSGTASRWRSEMQLSRDFHPDAWRAYDKAVVAFCRRVDDTAALPYVEPLAEQQWNRELAAEARDCLAYLREVAARQAQAAPLLRPADAPGDDALLRPAGPAPEAQPDRLLRPADGGTGGG